MVKWLFQVECEDDGKKRWRGEIDGKGGIRKQH